MLGEDAEGAREVSGLTPACPRLRWLVTAWTALGNVGGHRLFQLKMWRFKLIFIASGWLSWF